MRPTIANLWINDGKIDEAVEFYCSQFPESRVLSSSAYGPDAGRWAGTTMVVNFELNGQTFAAINGGDTSFVPNESVSLAVPCETQDEIDRLWAGLTDGGEPGVCGWLKDRYGFSWQVYPSVLDEMMSDSDSERVRRVTACFMALDRVPFSIADLETAYEGR